MNSHRFAGFSWAKTHTGKPLPRIQIPSEMSFSHVVFGHCFGVFHENLLHNSFISPLRGIGGWFLSYENHRLCSIVGQGTKMGDAMVEWQGSTSSPAAWHMYSWLRPLPRQPKKVIPMTALVCGGGVEHILRYN